MKKIFLVISILLLVIIDTSGQAPVNDDCGGAINITPDISGNFSAPYSTIGATQSLPGCAGVAEDDIWFKFTATDTRHRIWISQSSKIFDPVIEVFSGKCGSLNSIGCFSTISDNPSTLNADLSNLSSGTTYYFRVYDKLSNSPNTDISVWIIPLPPAPSNDECSGAITLPVNSDQSCTNTYIGEQSYATQSMPSCIPTGYNALDVWYKFVATSTTHRITVSPHNYRDIIFEVFAGDCGSLTSISCSNPGGLGQQDVVTLENLTVGATYYIRVYDKYANTSDSQFTICINSTMTILPVTFVNFNVVKSENGCTLTWTTSTEINNSGFKVQRSYDGVNFKNLHKVESKAQNGNSSSILRYLFLDTLESPNESKIFYRLNQVGFDGNNKYSTIVGVFNKPFNYKIYPNPASNLLYISGVDSRAVSYDVFDMLGKKALSGELRTKSINISNLSPGMYIIKFLYKDQSKQFLFNKK